MEVHYVRAKMHLLNKMQRRVRDSN